MRITFLLLFVGCFAAHVSAQKFTSFSEDKQLLDVKDIGAHKNAVVFGDKIYYTTPLAGTYGASNLAVAGLDGSNPRVLTSVTMNGANYLAATDKFIYFNSFVASAKYYQLFRYDPASDKVETVGSERDGYPWSFCGEQIGMSRMYAKGDKLVLAGTFKMVGADFRSLAIVEDAKPVAHILYLDEMPNVRDYRRLELMYFPAFNDIALTDSSVYVYSMRSETKKKMLYVYAANPSSNRKDNPNAKYGVETVVDFSKFDFTPLHHDLVEMQGEIFTLVTLNNRPKDSKKTSLVRFNRRHSGTAVAELELDEYNLFMEVVGKNLYIGNDNVLYHYSVKNGAQLIATTKGQGYFGYIQQEKRLLHAADGTVFLSHKQCGDNQTGANKNRGLSKILAIDPTFRTENVATIDNVFCNNRSRYSEEHPSYDSCFVVGNTLCMMNHANNEDWLMTYDKKTNWAATRLNFPEQKDLKKYYNGIAPTFRQLPNGVLMRTEYRKGKKQKKEVMLLLQPLKSGETAPAPKPSAALQKPLKQFITDENFAAAIRKQCPDCINEANNLLAFAQTVTKLVVNEQKITDLTGLEAFTALTELECNSNKLTALPKLPSMLKVLYCGSNKLSKLPQLPSTLERLYCYGNPLGTLPTLPSGLKILSCATNQLTALPTLPSGLITLNCAINPLKTLPTLPATLETLSCSENELTTLPKLPEGLRELTCTENQLTELPMLPATLTELNCGQNKLIALPKLPNKIEKIVCTENMITQLPLLPNSLKQIYLDSKIKCIPNKVEGLKMTNEQSRTFKARDCTETEMGKN